MLNISRKCFWVIAVLDICSIDQLELAGSLGQQPLLTGQVSEWYNRPKSGEFGWIKRFRTALGLR